MTLRRRVATLAAVVAIATTGLATTTTAAASLVPVAVDDTTTVIHGRTRTVAAPGVLANDLLVDVELLPGESFSADLVSGPGHGSLDLDADGGYVYHADDDWIGTDQFTYRVAGGLLGLSNVATVRITVRNRAPVAVADEYDAVRDVEMSVSVPGLLANDDDPDGDPLEVDVVVETHHGNLNEDDDGSFRYKADDVDYTGPDEFTYRLWDGFTWSNTVMVTINITSPGPSPTSAPTASPTSAPTAAPTTPPAATAAPTTKPPATPRPTTPAATATPNPAATVQPTTPPTPGDPTPTPVPSGASVPTATPSSTAGPSTSATASPTPGPSASASPSPAALGGGSTGSGGGGDGGTGVPAAPDPGEPVARPDGPFTVAAAAGPGLAAPISLDAVAVAFGGFEWAVPAFVLTVPGLLLVLAVLAQALIGLAWLPVTRRWLGGERTAAGVGSDLRRGPRP